MPSSAWAREKAEALLGHLRQACSGAEYQRSCPGCSTDREALAAALAEAEARGASRLRERIREAKGRIEDREIQLDYSPSRDALGDFVEAQLAALLEEEG